MDGPVLVHALVDVREAVEGQPIAQASLRAVRRAVLGPGGVQRLGRGVAEAVAAILGIERGVEEEDAVRKRVREVRSGRLEDTLGSAAGKAEAAESDAKGEAQVVGRGLGVELFDVIGERRALGAVDGGLGPVLGVAPGGGAGTAELDGGLTVGFVDSKVSVIE